VISQPQAKPPLQVTEASPATIKNWIAGQILEATVLKQLSANSALLKIAQAQITAITDRPLPAETKLQLRVIRAGDQPVLQILNQPRSTTEIKLSALRQIVPKQTPLDEVFSNLRMILSEKEALPPEVLRVLQSLNNGILSRRELINPKSVKKALMESGIFLESNLGKNTDKSILPSPVDDLKARLLRLTAILGNEPPRTPIRNSRQKQGISNSPLMSLLSAKSLPEELHKQVDSALARIQLNQLNSLQGSDHNHQAFLMEVPVRDKEGIDVFSFKITEEEKRKEDRSTSGLWSIKLSFNLNRLGTIHAKLVLGGEQIKASLWADEQETFELIQNHLDLLRQRLTDVDFIDPKVMCFRGNPESENNLSCKFNELLNIEI